MTLLGTMREYDGGYKGVRTEYLDAQSTRIDDHIFRVGCVEVLSDLRIMAAQHTFKDLPVPVRNKIQRCIIILEDMGISDEC